MENSKFSKGIQVSESKLIHYLNENVKKEKIDEESLVRSMQVIRANCESEIERNLAYAIYLVSKLEGLDVQFYSAYDFIGLYKQNKKLIQSSSFFVIPNMPITVGTNKYRVDFMIVYRQKGKKKVKMSVIECDSFMFHSTPAQLEKDKKRERDIRKNGFDVYAFSGKEIHEHPFTAASEIVSTLYKGV